MIDVEADAVFDDPARPRYRYWLRRRLGMFGRPVAFIAYNPSVAGFVANDPSARRMIGFAQAAEGSDLIVVNTMAAIATDPADLDAVEDPVGPLADAAIAAAAQLCRDRGGIVVAAWGVPKGSARIRAIAQARASAIRAMRLPLHVLRLTASGHPEHPLYLPGELRPQPWNLG